jgi:hypothetical protein
MADEVDQVERAFELCKLQASADGAFDEGLMRQWFDSAWALCAAMVNLTPPTPIEEKIIINPENGSFFLSHVPTPGTDVEVYDKYQLVATIPASLIRQPCANLCCLCDPWVKYMTGQQSCEVSPTFIMAVMRLFAYMVENRGDSELDREVLAKCGALTFLSPDLCYVL